MPSISSASQKPGEILRKEKSMKRLVNIVYVYVRRDKIAAKKLDEERNKINEGHYNYK